MRGCAYGDDHDDVDVAADRVSDRSAGGGRLGEAGAPARVSPVVRGKRGPYPRRVTKRATYADIEALPEHLTGELIDGDLIVSPRPAVVHSRAASRLHLSVGGPFDLGNGGPGGWVILPEQELHLGEDVLVPDLSGWRRERMPELPRVVGIRLPPDWLCEVLSPSTERIDRARKLAVYARARVGIVWLVNPLTQTLEVLKLGTEGWKLAAVHSGHEKVRAEPFEAVELDLALLWQT